MRLLPFRREFGFGLGLAVLLFSAPTQGDEPPKEVRPGEALILPPAGRTGRIAIPIDPVGGRIAAGTWQAPRAGDAFPLPDGRSLTWDRMPPSADGSYQGRQLNNGHAFFSVASERERVMVLEASGHGMVWVNGEPRAGDSYAHGFVHVPVQLRKGPNEFLFAVARGQLQARLTTPPGDIFFHPADTTLPDLIGGESYDGWGAVPVINATTSWQAGLTVTAALPGAASKTFRLPALPPLSVSKVPFPIAGTADPAADSVLATLELRRAEADPKQPAARAEIRLRVLKTGQTHKRTFRSRIDDSVQYYALVPATSREPAPGLTLTLHGAAVEGLGQAACFQPKPWTHVVAATNRRPFGFDWEDWGRLDALEVLDLTMRELKADPRRVWLTGHSMGGHGTWHLGVTYPDRFAAIGPSAGWVSMMSYAGVRRPDNPDALAELFVRAASPSDTLALVKNLAPVGVYVLHGDQDDNVPVGQARTMRKVLGEFHAD
jgi:pimeloyl-ACP methyl ester carboxylesterase